MSRALEVMGPSFLTCEIAKQTQGRSPHGVNAPLAPLTESPGASPAVILSDEYFRASNHALAKESGGAGLGRDCCISAASVYGVKASLAPLTDSPGVGPPPIT